MLTELTDYAFSENGPVHRILGQHRSVQANIAHQFAEFVETHHQANDTTVSLNEQRGGLGKTAAYGIVLMLHLSLTGERAGYATFTRALRNSIKAQEDSFNTIVQQTLEANGLTYRPVSIVEIQSPTAMISPTKCAAIRARLDNDRIPSADVIEVRDFLDCVEMSERPCEFADLYALMPTLPCGWTELALALCSQDRDTEDWNIVQQSRKQATNPRTLILMTHAMVIRNNLRGGRLFDQSSEMFSVKTLVIDEADKLPTVANSSLRFTVSKNELLAVANDAQETSDDQALINGVRRLEESITRLDVSYVKEDDAALRVATAVAGISDTLKQMMQASNDVLVADRIQLCLDNVRVIAKMAEFDYPILRIASARDPLGQHDIHLTLEIGGGRQLINQMWRNGSGLETVSMVSALMTNLPPHTTRYDRFRRDIGLDRTQGDRFVERQPLHPPYGAIRRIVVADRVTELLPTDTEQANLLRRTSLDALAAQITTAALRRAEDQRTAVLFQSYAAMAEVFQRLPEDIQSRVVTRNRRHLSVVVAELADRPHGIWFGVEWEGINFVHPVTRRTMVTTLIITRLPLAPRDEIRALRLGVAFDSRERGQSVALFEGIHACYRKLYHGVVMGIRNPDDVIEELWMLDPRWPLPSHVYQRQPPVIARSINGSLFKNFERVVGPYDVENWDKVNAEGNIETILQA